MIKEALKYLAVGIVAGIALFGGWYAVSPRSVVTPPAASIPAVREVPPVPRPRLNTAKPEQRPAHVRKAQPRRHKNYNNGASTYPTSKNAPRKSGGKALYRLWKKWT